jgi:hypothetical protein
VAGGEKCKSKAAEVEEVSCEQAARRQLYVITRRAD